MRFMDWVLKLPTWLGTIIFLTPWLLAIIIPAAVIISTSIAHTQEAQVKCEAAGGELLKATGKGGNLACVKKEYIIDWEGK